MSTGYEGSSKPVEPIQVWLVEKEMMYPSKILARISVNGEARGFLNIHSEEEFRWLKSRVDGDRRLEERELKEERP